MKNLLDFQKNLKQNNLDGFIVTNPVNILYLTGFKGISFTERESLLLFTPFPTLIAPRLYQNEAQKCATKDLKVVIVNERNQVMEEVKKLLSPVIMSEAKDLTDSSPGKAGTQNDKFSVGFEEQDLKYAEYQEFKKALSRTKLIPHKDLIEKLRIVKSEEEIKNIETAQVISQKAFDKLLKTIKPGQTEEEIAERLNKIMKSLGGHGIAFETIVASGPNAALPHHVTSNRRLNINDVLLLDFGAKFNNFHADVSRTIFVGKAKDDQKNVFYHVLNAQKKAIEKITHGTKAQNAYHNANNVFKDLNLHDFFLHGLGHGVGLEIHEAPYLRPSIEDELEENMVFSIEPGLYFPQWGGVRIEDLVVIKNGKAKVLGKLSENLIEL